jgi:hypothetical protein
MQGEYAASPSAPYSGRTDMIASLHRLCARCKRDECGNGIDDDCNAMSTTPHRDAGLQFRGKCKTACPQQERKALHEPVILTTAISAAGFTQNRRVRQFLCSRAPAETFGDPCTSIGLRKVLLPHGRDGVKRCLSCHPRRSLADESAHRPEVRASIRLSPSPAANWRALRIDAQCKSGNCFVWANAYCTVSCSDTQPAGSLPLVFGDCVRASPRRRDPCI